MRGKNVIVVAGILLVAALSSLPAPAASQSIIGKWQVKAETPNGPMDLEFEWKQEGDTLAGVATVMQTLIPFTSVKFEDPNMTAVFGLGGSSYRLAGVVSEGKITGTWEQVSSDLKGTWTATLVGPPAAPALAAGPGTLGISGTWSSVAVTPGAEVAARLDLRQEGEQVSGQFTSDMGALAIQAGSFKENKLQFEIVLGGATYRVQASLEGDKLTGAWAPAAGGDGGAWNAKRSAASPAAAAESASWAEGAWAAVATSPEGEMKFEVALKKAADGWSGSVIAPEGSLALKNVTVAGMNLTFEVDYMGGRYRIEGTVDGNKITGKWSAVGGGESGSFSAQRK